MGSPWVSEVLGKSESGSLGWGAEQGVKGLDVEGGVAWRWPEEVAGSTGEEGSAGGEA